MLPDAGRADTSTGGPARIAIYEDKLHAAITVNRDALKEAEELDRERAQGKIRGPVHGIPVSADQAKVMAEAIEVLKKQGAVLVDPAAIPSVVEKDTKNNFLSWNICSGWSDAKGKDADCSVSFKYGMKRDFNKWLASLGPSRQALPDPTGFYGRSSNAAACRGRTR